MYNVYLNVSYDETVIIKELVDDRNSVSIVEALTQYILRTYNCILNVVLDKNKNDIVKDTTLKQGYYLSQNMKIYKKDKIVDAGYFWNSYNYQMEKLGSVVVVEIKSDELLEKEANEEFEFLKKVSNFLNMVRDTKDIKDRCVVLDTFFKFVTVNKYILNRNGKFDDLKIRLKNILLSVETDVKKRGMDLIFEPRKYYDQLFKK